MNRILICCVTALCTLSIYAQKPVATRSFEQLLPAENENWAIQGNMRVAARTGHPVAVYNAYFRVNAASPESMAREYLSMNKNIFGFTNADIDNLRLHAIRTDETGTTVRLRQTWKGLPVNKNAEVTIHISEGNIVDFVMNGFEYGIQLQDVTPVISRSAARTQLATRIDLRGDVSYESNELMLLHHGQQDYLVYRVNITAGDPLGDWEAYVDAKTGALLQVRDAAVYHHAKKQPAVPKGPYIYRPQVLVNGTGNVFDPDPLTTAHAAYGGSYVDGTDANAAVLTAQLKSVTLLDITQSAGVFSLVGPYAAVADFEAPNKGLFTQATSTFAFDRAADNFEAVNTYYLIDQSMRYLNTTLGLTIMPYQYTGGVKFDPSGLNGADNSHYLGATGQLAFGEGGVDDAEDADVVIHELGHGIHDWVTFGGLSQVDGLSEGTGDYWAASYSRFKGGWTAADAAYNWTFNWDGHNPFWGGRVINYAAIYPGGLVNAIHTDGQIWATAMMKIWDDIGRQKADKAFWTGLGMTNGTASQNDAANAVFLAAQNLHYTNAERQKIYNRFTAAGYTLPAFIFLPSTLVKFDVVKSGEQAKIIWTTQTENNTRSFIIERSADGKQFDPIGEKAAAGQSSSARSYSFYDKQPIAGLNYYRLKQIDADGKTAYSAVVTVKFDVTGSLLLYPNPAYDRLTLKTGLTGGMVYLFDLNGRQVAAYQITAGSGTITVPVDRLPEGMYVVKMVSGGNEVRGTFLKKK